ncbi:MAG: hypothetical protein ACKO23_20195 [Gemmataceae bacterium]
MAFNPFNWFRKNQKVIFAGLTILCMVVFIGQWGAGDVFTRMLARFGSSRASGQPVASLYGQTVREGDLEKEWQMRRMASDFLFSLAFESHPLVCKNLLDEKLKSTSTENPLSGLREIVASAQQRSGTGLLEMAQRMQTQPQFLRFLIEQDLNRVEEIATREEVKNDPEKLATLQKVASILGFQFWLAEPTRLMGLRDFFLSNFRVFPKDLYFSGSDKADDLLDFRLWKAQADRLGIQLSDDDVQRELIAEGAGNENLFDSRFSFQQDPRVQRFLKNMREGPFRWTAEDLQNALRDEFRVVMAQGLLLGAEPGARAYRLALGATSSPALATPDEFLNYFRQQRTTLRVKFLTIPVSAFLDKVQAKPTEGELQTRFERYKEKEPSPALREPGFKEPRRVQVEYLVGSPADAFYTEKGKGRLIGQAAGTVGSSLPLGLVAGVVNDPIRQAYDAELRRSDFPWFYDPRDTVSMLDERIRKVHTVSLLQPNALASMVAGAVGGGPLSGSLQLGSMASLNEIRESARFNLTKLLSMADPGQIMASAGMLAKALPEPVSQEVLEPLLIANISESNAREELETNLRKFREELAKFRGRSNAGKDFVAKSAKEMNLRYYTMPRPMTKDAIVTAIKRKEDIGLETLREAFQKVVRQEKPEFFADALFMQVGTYEPNQFPVDQPRREEFVFWRSEDLVSRTRDYSVVRGEVEQAWKMEEARKLARAHAESLESTINQKNLNASDAVRLLNEQKPGPIFELDSIARLVAPREVLPARRTEYNPYTVPDDMARYLEFPPEDLAKQLMTLKRPGEATVIVDRPGSNFFVAVLLDRNEPSVNDFKGVYARTPKEDSLYASFIDQRRSDYRRMILEQMRRDASGGELDRDGRFKIPESIRNRESGTRQEDE